METLYSRNHIWVQLNLVNKIYLSNV
jgi:hypothetical protein